MTDPRQQAAEARELAERYIEIAKPTSDVSDLAHDVLNLADTVDALCGRLEQAAEARPEPPRSPDLHEILGYVSELEAWGEALCARLEQAEKLDHRLLRQGTIKELRGSLLQEARYRRVAEEDRASACLRADAEKASREDLEKENADLMDAYELEYHAARDNAERAERYEKALQQIADYRGRVARPVEHRKIARAALEEKP